MQGLPFQFYRQYYNKYLQINNMKKQLLNGLTTPQRIYVNWLMDILTYVIILNLFNQYFDNFYINNFALSILVAISMKMLMVVILALKDLTSGYFKSKQTSWSGFASLFTKFLILFSSKFVVLEVLNWKYNDLVNIDGFVAVTVLILTMIIVRIVLEKIFVKLGASKVE
jgi:hypothetical protein